MTEQGEQTLAKEEREEISRWRKIIEGAVEDVRKDCERRCGKSPSIVEKIEKELTEVHVNEFIQQIELKIEDHVIRLIDEKEEPQSSDGLPAEKQREIAYWRGMVDAAIGVLMAGYEEQRETGDTLETVLAEFAENTLMSIKRNVNQKIDNELPMGASGSGD